MLWIKAIHLIAMVAWFAGLFYLPRLFVYHSRWNNPTCDEHFKIMERKLYFMIMNPAAVLTVLFGFWTASYDFSGYMHAPWMHLKLTLVFLLILFHLYLGQLVRRFQRKKNTYPAAYFRWINEIPTFFLIVIVILAVVKPVF